MSADLARAIPSGRPLMTLPGVYAPQHDTRLLVAALNREGIAPGTEVLDVGTGSGALALHAARLGARVTAVDIARRAVATARLNALLHRRRITVQRSDLLSALPGRSYDLVICNPPYVPSPLDRLPGHGAARAWDAGCDGRAVLDRICATAPAALRPGAASCSCTPVCATAMSPCGVSRTQDCARMSVTAPSCPSGPCSAPGCAGSGTRG